jgi:hypothetical protein
MEGRKEQLKVRNEKNKGKKKKNKVEKGDKFS